MCGCWQMVIFCQKHYERKTRKMCINLIYSSVHSIDVHGKEDYQNLRAQPQSQLDKR